MVRQPGLLVNQRAFSQFHRFVLFIPIQLNTICWLDRIHHRTDGIQVGVLKFLTMVIHSWPPQEIASAKVERPPEPVHNELPPIPLAPPEIESSHEQIRSV